MKIYYFIIISLGIMFLMALAGVDGIGTHVTSLFINNDTIVQPTTQYNGTVGNDISTITDSIKNRNVNFFQAILIGLLAIVTISVINGVQILGSGTSFDAQTIIKAAVSYLIFGLFVSDMWSLLTLVFSYGTAWVSWTMAFVISIYVAGFAIAALEFVGGSD